jgi:hypothetical protein
MSWLMLNRASFFYNLIKMINCLKAQAATTVDSIRDNCNYRPTVKILLNAACMHLNSNHGPSLAQFDPNLCVMFSAKTFICLQCPYSLE